MQNTILNISLYVIFFAALFAVVIFVSKVVVDRIEVWFNRGIEKGDDDDC